MTFPHAHKKRSASRIEVILKARQDNVLHECFIYSAKLVLNLHNPVTNSQQNTAKLLKDSIVAYYKLLPEELKQTNNKSRGFKELVLGQNMEQVQECCALSKPGFDSSLESRIYHLTLDCVKQNGTNKYKKPWKNKSGRKRK